MKPLPIDFVADIVCPWCFLGKARLDQALAMTPGIPVKLRWRPFQLQPDMPREDMDQAEFVARLFGSAEAYHERSKPLVAMARESGLNYRHDLIRRQPNTLDAHRPVAWASRMEGGDRSWDMAGRLMTMLMSEGENLTDPAVLARAANDVGLDPHEVTRRLASDEDVDAVREQAAHARRSGIQGVPTYIFAKRYGASGAQPVDVLARAIRQIETADLAGNGQS